MSLSGAIRTKHLLFKASGLRTGENAGGIRQGGLVGTVAWWEKHREASSLGSFLNTDDVLKIITVTLWGLLWYKTQDFLHDRQML